MMETQCISMANSQRGSVSAFHYEINKVRFQASHLNTDSYRESYSSILVCTSDTIASLPKGIWHMAVGTKGNWTLLRNWTLSILLGIEHFWEKNTLEPPLIWEIRQIVHRLAFLARDGILIDIYARQLSLKLLYYQNLSRERCR